MKTQWQIYQELELIPDAVPKPKISFWAHLVSPLRRSLSNSFVRDLADRHRVFLFNRCLNAKHVQGSDIQPAEMVPSKVRQWPRSGSRLKQSISKSSIQALKVQVQQQVPSRSTPFWWTWYDAR
jgi:hypothetical protein